MCKKRKLNSSLEKYTYTSTNKAIRPLKSDSSDKTEINIANKKSDPLVNRFLKSMGLIIGKFP